MCSQSQYSDHNKFNEYSSVDFRLSAGYGRSKIDADNRNLTLDHLDVRTQNFESQSDARVLVTLTSST